MFGQLNDLLSCLLNWKGDLGDCNLTSKEGLQALYIPSEIIGTSKVENATLNHNILLRKLNLSKETMRSKKVLGAAYRLGGPFCGLRILFLLYSYIFLEGKERIPWFSSDAYLHIGAKELKKKGTHREKNFLKKQFYITYFWTPFIFFKKSPRPANNSRKLRFFSGISSFSSF